MPAHDRTADLDRAARAGLAALLDAAGGTFGAGQVAVSACLYDRAPMASDPGPYDALAVWSHDGDRQIYPASLCKLFYLGALAAFADAGRITLDDEDHRATRAMIALSSNDATTYLLGRLTGAFDGPPLDEGQLADWIAARGAVQAWLTSLGQPALDGTHLLHSTYEDSPYGRAWQSRQVTPGNCLSPRACASFLHDVLRGALPQHDWMAGQLSRDWQRNEAQDAEGNQIAGYLGQGVPAAFRLWSKAGHTSWTRHDVASIMAPDGRGATLAVMTEGPAAARCTRSLPAFAAAFVAEAFGPAKTTSTNKMQQGS